MYCFFPVLTACCLFCMKRPQRVGNYISVCHIFPNKLYSSYIYRSRTFIALPWILSLCNLPVSIYSVKLYMLFFPHSKSGETVTNSRFPKSSIISWINKLCHHHYQFWAKVNVPAIIYELFIIIINFWRCASEGMLPYKRAAYYKVKLVLLFKCHFYI